MIIPCECQMGRTSRNTKDGSSCTLQDADVETPIGQALEMALGHLIPSKVICLQLQSSAAPCLNCTTALPLSHTTASSLLSQEITTESESSLWSYDSTFSRAVICRLFQHFCTWVTTSSDSKDKPLLFNHNKIAVRFLCTDLTAHNWHWYLNPRKSSYQWFTLYLQMGWDGLLVKPETTSHCSEQNLHCKAVWALHTTVQPPLIATV